MKRKLVISAGSGPAPARHFVSALVRHLDALARQWGLHLSPCLECPLPSLPRSVEYWIEGPEAGFAAFQGECGTHALVQAATHPSDPGRKRWLASVTLLELPTPAPGSATHLEVEFTAIRSRGPGGQNVNKRSTAVRLKHRPSGLELRVQDQRTQAANRRTAFQRLNEKLNDRRTALETAMARREWIARHSVPRISPVREYRMGRGGQLEAVCSES